MAIEFGAATIASATTLTLPTHQTNDLLLMAFYRHDSNTTPTIPSGWIVAKTGSSNTQHLGVAYKYASSGAETSGTWTSATQLACASYRSDSGKLLALGGGITTSGNGVTSITYGNVLSSGSNNGIGVSNSWYVGICGSRTDGAAETAPTGMTNRVNAVSTGELALHDTDGNATSFNQSVATSAIVMRAITQEIYELEYTIPTGSGGVPLIGTGGLVY